MEYIIYSNGKDGYRLYDSSKNFPESYTEKVKSLYGNNGCIAVNNDSGDMSVRLAPLGEKYAVSVIFRNCNNLDDRRSMIATVNWILNDEEVSDLFAMDTKGGLHEIMRQSEEILKSKGYNLPGASLGSKGCHIYKEREKALMAAAYNTTKQGKSGRNSVPDQQVFVGCESFVDAFEMTKNLFITLPTVFYKYLSIYIGATEASETYGSALVFMNKEKLKSVRNNSDYGGIRGKKLVECEGIISNGVPLEVERYAQLDKHSLGKLNAFSKCIGDDPSLYWKIVKYLFEHRSVSTFNLTALLDNVGEEFVIEIFKNNLFEQTEEWIRYIDSDRKTFLPYKKLMKYVEDRMIPINKQDEAKRKEEQRRKAEEQRRKEEEEQRRKEEEKQRKKEEAERKKAGKKKTNTSKNVNSERDADEHHYRNDRACEDVDQPEGNGDAIAKKIFNSRKATAVAETEGSDVDKEAENESDQDNASLFGLTGSLMKSYKFLYLAIAVLSFAVIVLVDVFAFSMATKLSAGDLNEELLNKAVTTQNYILTIVGLNFINIPVGFTLIASVVELIKDYLNRK